MLSGQEIKKISAIISSDIKKDLKDIVKKKDLKFAIQIVKEDIHDLREDTDGLREGIQRLTLAIDHLVKSVNDLKDEYTLVGEK